MLLLLFRMDSDLICGPIALPYMFSASVDIMRDVLGTVASGDGGQRPILVVLPSSFPPSFLSISV
jgi:hypothetical protein